MMCEHIHMHYVFMCGVYTSHIISHSKAKHMRNGTCSFNELLFTSCKLLNSPLFRQSKQAMVSAIPWKPIDGIVVSGSSVLPSKHKIFQHYPGLCEFPQHVYINL